MELKSVKLKPWSKEFRHVKRLLKSQIPPDERLPFAELLLGTCRKKADCTCFYDQDTLAGFYYVLIKEKAVFLLYLVVNPAVQSRGYGTAILRELEKKYPGKQIDLHIEIPKDLCSLEEQAAKRYRFYERAGFRYTGWTTEDDGVKYWIVSNCGTGFDTQAHSAFLIKDRKTGKAIFNHEQA